MRTLPHEPAVLRPGTAHRRKNTSNEYLLNSARGMLLVVLLATLFSGCSVVDSFQPEVVPTDGGEITIKGWQDVEKSQFNVQIALKPSSENVTLHSLNLLCPDGEKRAPDSWKDETPRSSAPRLSFGIGLGLGGGDGAEHPNGHGEGGSRTILTPGVSVPLGKEDSTRAVTKVAACWSTANAQAEVDLS